MQPIAPEVDVFADGSSGYEAIAVERPQAADGSGTPPTNRVPDNCNTLVRPFRLGVDSLYLSYRGGLSPERDDQLRELKEAAQSGDASAVSLAQLRLGEHVFEVKDKGSGLFPYVLEDNAFRISLSRTTATRMPMAYVKISAHRLASALPATVEAELRGLLAELGEVAGNASVSRVDLYVDFASEVDMEGWGREAWVGRGLTVNSYAEGDSFSGWTIGQRGPVSARLYDKTLEIKKSGKTWLYDLWEGAGWNGKDRVWRLEFQLRREGLGVLPSVEFSVVLGALGGLWRYCTHDWLRLCIPNPADATRARWPVHPLWIALQGLEWGNGPAPLSRRFTAHRAPKAAGILRQVTSLLFSLMALRGIYDYGAGIAQLCTELQSYVGQRGEERAIDPRKWVHQQVALRVRKFNLALNADEIRDEDRLRAEADELLRAATDYRRASRGG